MVFVELTEEMKAISSAFENLSEEIRANTHSSLPKQWYTLKDAADLKGVSYEKLRHSPRYLWPAMGRSTQVFRTGRYSKMYSREDVSAWLTKTETELEAEYRRSLSDPGNSSRN